NQLIATRQFASIKFARTPSAGRESHGILLSVRTKTPRPIRPLREVGTPCSTRCMSQSWTDRLRTPPLRFHPIGSRRTRQVPTIPPSPHNTLESSLLARVRERQRLRGLSPRTETSRRDTTLLSARILYKV